MKHFFQQVGMVVCMLFLSISAQSGDFTRGIGIYPGNIQEHFAPVLVTDTTYRNVALHRMVRHSSAYDYNLTAQLLTDGIVSTQKPAWLSTSTNNGILPKREREWTIDGNQWTRNIAVGANAFIEYRWYEMGFKANKIDLFATVVYREELAKNGYTIQLLNDNGKGKWTVLSQIKGDTLPGKSSRYKAHSDPNKNTGTDLLPTRTLNLTFNLPKQQQNINNLRLVFKMNGAEYWTVTELKCYENNELVNNMLPSTAFNSTWMSAGKNNEWVSIDLGEQVSFDKIRLHWLNKAIRGCVEISDDGQFWKPISALSNNNHRLEEIVYKGKARHVRVMMFATKNQQPFALSEIEVMGRGGLVAKPLPQQPLKDGKLALDGGAWRLIRASEVAASGKEIAMLGFDDSRWLAATVPATVLMSHVNVGAIDNPNYADNLFYISESYFNSNFWYRNVFDVPAKLLKQHVMLCFDGINWKANIFINGTQVNGIEGAFIRGKIDVSKLLKAGKNVIAIEIIKNQHHGAIKEKNELNTDFNGGILGADNPTFHATIGWDWISTIRGRNIGIWNNVYLQAKSCVSVQDPLVVSTIDTDSLASMSASVVLKNHENHAIQGILLGWIGNLRFEQNITLSALATKEITFEPDSFKVLSKQKMKLWWPNGYGNPHLYDAGFMFITDGKIQDKVIYKAGIRQMTYRNIDTRLTLYINGKRFVPLGGNWGFSENNLCYRGREYDIAVKYHRDMKYNMIRNWVGQTGDEEFYNACDKYGLMVWQDFWLANPADGPDPSNENMFLCNAKDYVYRIRNHASIGLYCGRNEGYPPISLDTALRTIVKKQHPDIVYISNSADEGVSGHGPYWAIPSKEYFEKQTGKLHSERGMPCVMTFEGLARTLKPSALWPQNNLWGQHDYVLEGAQRGATFNKMLETAFGKPQSAKQFTTLSQWINYEGYRAMYESGSKDRLGLLIWMSHSCWPSMTWQTYDYYFEPTAAFFGVKKACETLHIQYNSSTRNMEVVNLNEAVTDNLKAHCDVLDMYGKVIKSYSTILQTAPDSTVICNNIAEPSDYMGVYYLRMRLTDEQEKERSTNFYVCSTQEGNLQALNQLPAVMLSTTTEWQKDKVTITLKNTNNIPAMMVRLNLKGIKNLWEKDVNICPVNQNTSNLLNHKEQILPVEYSDNYFHLMPEEQKTITIHWKNEDTLGRKPIIEISGFNVVNSEELGKSSFNF